MRCSTCNAENASKAKFCRQCGAAATRQIAAARPAIKRCKNCKIVTPSDSQYCSQCGESMMVTLVPAELAAVKRSGSKRYAVAATLLLGMSLAVLGVHLFGGGSVLPSSQTAATAGLSLAGATQNSSTPAVKPWLSALRADLRRCEGESIFAQPFCREKAKYKHCSNRWGSVIECPKADLIEP